LKPIGGSMSDDWNNIVANQTFEVMRDLERRIAKLEARQPRGLEALSDAELSARIDELMGALIAVDGHAAARATVASKHPELLEIFDEHAAKIGLGSHA
jgi:hypothetical protein